MKGKSYAKRKEDFLYAFTLINNIDTWTRGTFARDDLHVPVSPHSSYAC